MSIKSVKMSLLTGLAATVPITTCLPSVATEFQVMTVTGTTTNGMSNVVFLVPPSYERTLPVDAVLYPVPARSTYVLRGYTTKARRWNGEDATAALNDKRLERHILKEIRNSDFAPPGSGEIPQSVY